jgi:hypothetical protein
MSEEEVMMAVGEPVNKTPEKNGIREWHYNRSNGVLLVVQLNDRGKVVKAGGRAPKTTSKKKSQNNGRLVGNTSTNDLPTQTSE